MTTMTPASDLRIMLLEPDPELLRRASRAGADAGLDLLAYSPGPDWPEQVVSAHPDVLLVDAEFARYAAGSTLVDIQRQAGPAAIQIILVAEHEIPERFTGELPAGADDFAPKVYTSENLHRILDSIRRFILTFWGVRGTLPVPGAGTLRYGGNTSCVSMEIGRDRQFVLDAGTGIKALSDHLRSTAEGRFHGHILISHPHWDHLAGLPFFAPLYLPGNRIELHGPPHPPRSLRDLIGAQMDGVFFPITLNDLEADVTYHDMDEGEHRFGGVAIAARRLQHPGLCLAYRIRYGGRSVAYVTDNELALPTEDARKDGAFQQLANFVRNVDVLIHDTTYFDDEYRTKVNWGHSAVGPVTELAHASGVRHFYLFHHDPEHDDAAIDRKLAIAQTRLEALGSRTRCHIAAEGMELDLQRL